MIPGDLLSAFPHRQFHTLPGLLDSWAALPNSYPNACMPMQGGSMYHFYDGLWYDPAEWRTHDLPCERRTRYRLSQPDTVQRNRYNPYNNLNYLSISRKVFSICLIDAKLSCFVRKMFVECSETVIINLHVIGNTFVNIRLNSHTLHFHHSDWFQIVRDF